MTKHCPFMVVSKILSEVTGASGIRGCTVTVDTMCGEEACALWNENQKKCAIACKYQPEQPNRQPFSKHDAEEEKQHSGLLEE